jgi:hypothetical protein
MRTTEQLQPSRFLRRQDLGHHELHLRIAGVTIEALGARLCDSGWVLHFDSTEKLLLLDERAIAMLEQSFGRDTDFWPGRAVVLFLDEAQLRLRPARRERAARQGELALDGEPRATATRSASVVQFPRSRWAAP